MHPVAVIAAPSDLGLRPSGVAELPRALRRAGILRTLRDVEDAGAIDVPGYVSIRDSATGIMNPQGIREVSQDLAALIETSLGASRFPLVLGGDCSILLGVMLALKRRGRYGLLFLDGHADFYSAEAEPNGEVASMELALITGREPQLLAGVVEPPLVRENDVVVFGVRDCESAASYGSPDVRDTRMRVLDLWTVQRTGAAAAAREAVSFLERSGVEGFWIHLDADVLDDDVMPAVDYRMPGGLTPDELVSILRAALQSEKVVGLDITIYNPSLDDESLSAGRVLAAAVSTAFAAVDAGPQFKPGRHS